METKIYEAKTIDEAIQKGLADLGMTDRSAVEVEVIQEPRKGFLGLGEKKAIIQLSSAKPIEVAPLADEQTSAQPGEAAAAAETTVSAADMPAIDSDNESEAVDAEENTPAEPSVVTPATTEAALTTANLDIFGSDEEDDGEEPAEELYDVDWVANYIIDVMKNYLVDVTVDVEDNDDTIIYHINTDKPGLVIGKHGKIINAMEVLAQVLTHRHVRSRVRVALNVGDYRERRHHILENLAERIADDVTMNQNTEYLDPLPARERKIVHQTLAKYQHIQTHSEGREPRRYLVVSYKD